MKLPSLLLLALPAFAPIATASVDDERKITLLFDTLVEGIEERESDIIKPCFDLDLIEEVAQDLGGRDMEAFSIALEINSVFGTGIMDYLADLDIRSIAEVEDDRTVVITRSWDQEYDDWTVDQWWLARHGSEWRIYDWMDLDVGLRFTTMIASMSANPMEYIQYFTLVDKATNFFDEDNELAAQYLEGIETKTLGPTYEAHRLRTLASVHMLEFDYETSLELIDQSLELIDECPGTHLSRGTVLNELSRFEEGLKSLEVYRAAVGTGTAADGHVGYALIELGRRAEAWETLIAGLEADPESFDVITELVRLSDLGHDEELARHFAEFPDLLEWFDSIAEYLLEIEDLVAVRYCCEQLDVIAPDHASVEYYLADALGAEGKYYEAAELMAKRYGELAPEDQEYYLSSILYYGGYMAEDFVWAYELLPDHAAEAFGFLAYEMDGEDYDEAFENLAAVHEEKHPQDYQTPFYRALRHQYYGEYSSAEADYADAAKLAKGDDVDVVLEMRVDNLVMDGKVEQAYGLEPTERAWFWIQDSCIWAEEWEALGKAVAVRRADKPSDASLDLWAGLCAFYDDDYEKCVRLLSEQDIFSHELYERGFVWTFEGALARALVRHDFEDRDDILRDLMRQEFDDFNALLLRVAQGNSRRITTAARKVMSQGYTYEELLEDEDLTEALSDPDVKRRLGIE